MKKIFALSIFSSLLCTSVFANEGRLAAQLALHEALTNLSQVEQAGILKINEDAPIMADTTKKALIESNKLFLQFVDQECLSIVAEHAAGGSGMAEDFNHCKTDKINNRTIELKSRFERN